MHDSESGFTLAESLIALTLLLTVAGIITTGLIRTTEAQGTIWNRTEMHAGVRSATELLQQEVGQAGLITLPGAVTCQTAVVPGAPATVTLTSVTGMFVGEELTFDNGTNQETVPITAISTVNNTVTATFNDTHPANVPVSVLGGFANGVVPSDLANGSTGTVLKLFGDINGDGTMVYIEYTCDIAAGNLYRNVLAFDAAAKPAVTASQILLSNILANPGGTPCFTYQQQTINGLTYVTDVAITLTVQTQQTDPVTKRRQQETKALLNVSPRNVVNAWELSSNSDGKSPRIQPMPPSVANLLQ